MPFAGPQGGRLHFLVEGSGPDLVLLHGFTGSTQSFAALRAAWRTRFRLICVDLLGHGRSDAPADPARHAFAVQARALLDVLDAAGAASPALFGYSLGGRLALHMACRHPARVHRLVLESASPGLADAVERRRRRAADARLADAIEREGVAAFADRWQAVPLFQSQARLPPALLAPQRQVRLEQRAQGLAGSLRGAGSGSMAPLWTELPALGLPTLLVVGALDAKFRAIARAMSAQLGQASCTVVPDAGHNVHLERPRAFRAAVEPFLNRQTADQEG